MCVCPDVSGVLAEAPPGGRGLASEGGGASRSGCTLQRDKAARRPCCVENILERETTAAHSKARGREPVLCGPNALAAPGDSCSGGCESPRGAGRAQASALLRLVFRSAAAGPSSPVQFRPFSEAGCGEAVGMERLNGGSGFASAVHSRGGLHRASPRQPPLYSLATRLACLTGL